MNRAREELKNVYQEPGELITIFIYKYGQMHYLSTGIRAHRETHLFTITGFITGLEPKLKKWWQESMLMQERNLTLLKLFFRWQNDAPRKC